MHYMYFIKSIYYIDIFLYTGLSSLNHPTPRNNKKFLKGNTVADVFFFITSKY